MPSATLGISSKCIRTNQVSKSHSYDDINPTTADLSGVVLYPSLSSARFGSVLARAFGQKARLGSARSVSQKALFLKICKNELFFPQSFRKIIVIP